MFQRDQFFNYSFDATANDLAILVTSQNDTYDWPQKVQHTVCVMERRPLIGIIHLSVAIYRTTTNIEFQKNVLNFVSFL